VVVETPVDREASSSPWRLCTVTHVEELKSVVRLLPIWASGIVSTAVLAYALYGSTAVLAYALALSVAPREATRASGKDGATALHLVAAGGAVNAVAATHLLLTAGASTEALSASGLRAGDLLPRAATTVEKPLRPPAQVQKAQDGVRSLRA
jgi:hypothetical protein